MHIKCAVLTSLVADRLCLYSSKLKPELLSSPQDCTTIDEFSTYKELSHNCYNLYLIPH